MNHWFVTAIAAEGVETPGFDGNRLYRNDGSGQFEDVTDEAGVRVGGWGWGLRTALRVVWVAKGPH